VGLPSVEAEYLLQAVADMGWGQPAGMGVAALSHTEIAAWCALMQTDLEPWEVQAIRAASRAYCAQSTSKDPREPNFEATPEKPVSAIRALAEALNKKTAEPT
jgi:hypothetical protein